MKPEASHGALFHALVVMGGSLALGCGGMATDRKQASEPGTGGEAGQGDGGGASLGSGGSIGFGSGGSTGIGGFAVGGGFNVGTGGVGIDPNGGHPLFPDAGSCPPTQWDCSGVDVSCFGSQAWEVPTGCRCDYRRPASDSDCKPGEVFTCRASGPQPPDGPRQRFECSCVADQEGCTPCDEAFGAAPTYRCDEETHTDGSRAWRDVLCGCAVVYLR